MSLIQFRRSRLFAALLFVASPAVGGTFLPAIHPCPVDSPRPAQDPVADAHAGHHGATEDAPAEQHGGCHCIGSCLTAAVVAPAASEGVRLFPALASTWVLLPEQDSSLDLSRPSRLLPPATAPPAV